MADNFKTVYRVGDIVRMKKKHPCGGDLWEITRTGIDFGLKCLKCSRHVLLGRPKFERGVKSKEERENNEQR